MSVTDLDVIPFEEILKAKERLQGVAIRTPLIPLNVDIEGKKIYLKLENLQPIGSFKLRGAYNAMKARNEDLSQCGVLCPSAGNFAQGVCWGAQAVGCKATILTPDTAPQTKIDAIQRLHGEVVKVPHSEWWNVMVTGKTEKSTGQLFLHPVSDKYSIAGNGTIGLEILEDLPNVDTIIAPYGGGGLICGIASAIKPQRPDVRILACEVEGAAPLTAAFHEGHPVTLDTDDYQPTRFVDGMSGKQVLSEMWKLAQALVDDTVVVSLVEIAGGVRTLLERNRVLAEGAGAAPVAASMSDRVKDGGNIVCVVSGGNIDSKMVADIINGKTPA